MTRIETLAHALKIAGFAVLSLSVVQRYSSRSYIKINNNIGIMLGIVALALATWLTGTGFPMVN